jgi:hypothetical protein
MSEKSKKLNVSLPTQASEVNAEESVGAAADTGTQLRHHPLNVWDAGSQDIRKALATLVNEN